MQMSNQSQLETLIQINTDDILGALGLSQLQIGRRWVGYLCRGVARRFAQQVLAFDRSVAEVGLKCASLKMLQVLQNQLSVHGVENIPAQGPVCFLSNHPGLTDTLALFASIPSTNLQILAADRPFLRALNHTNQHLIYIDEKRRENLQAVRLSIKQLQSSGALLTFPAGKIEPDPTILPGAVESLQSWSQSVELFARTVPGTSFMPLLVSGVLNPRAQHSPIRYLRRSAKDREWLAAMLQILIPAYQAVHVQVDFGEPILASRFPRKSKELMNEVKRQMEGLITARVERPAMKKKMILAVDSP